VYLDLWDDILTPYEVIDALPGVPRDRSWPVFAEPWQAQVFALTADTLDILLREAVALDPRDDGSRYYEHWLIALERLCLAKGLTDSEALDMRTAAWVDDYRRAPDGRPVELAGGLGSLLNHSRYLPLKNQVRCTPERPQTVVCRGGRWADSAAGSRRHCGRAGVLALKRPAPGQLLG
jgi:hypothetical protein